MALTVLLCAGCSDPEAGLPGAAVATGDVESQLEADAMVSEHLDDMLDALPPPRSSGSRRIDRAVPAVLDAWTGTVTRELVHAVGPARRRRLLVKITADYEPLNTADWGGEPSPARVARCFTITPDPEDADGPGGVDPDWRAVQAPCGHD